MKLIDKDILATEIEALKERYRKIKIRNDYEDGLKDGRLIGYEDILYKLNTIEVKDEDTIETKDANLEKELERLDSLLYDLDGIAIAGTTSYLTVEDVKEIAKRFFEMGLNAQKGE